MISQIGSPELVRSVALTITEGLLRADQTHSIRFYECRLPGSCHLIPNIKYVLCAHNGHLIQIIQDCFVSNTVL